MHWPMAGKKLAQQNTAQLSNWPLLSTINNALTTEDVATNEPDWRGGS